MKKLITLILLVLCAATLFAQAPEKFSYQAVVRNTSNQLVTNAPVGVRVSILQGSADGEALYVETHTAVTNANGLLTLEIGGGKAEQGAFDRIDWANGPYFLKTETDPNGGGDYSITSVQQLLSVPYALYAKEAANSFSGDYNDLKNKPVIPQVPSDVSAFNNDAGYITLNDIPTSSKSDETNDAGVVQTTACGEIDLCDMASQLARLQAQFARQQAQMEETQTALLSTVDDSEPCPGTPTVKDIDGNVYNTVKIGEQCWMRENLRTTRYADGSPISAGGSNTSTTDPYYYDFPSSGIPLEKRGYLYNWPAAMHGAEYSETNPSNVQGICPDGWHLPSNAEWTQLTDYVGNIPDYVCNYELYYEVDKQTTIIKALSDTSGWGSQYYGDSECGSCAASFNPSTNNATGFSALPTGLWYEGFGGGDAWFWSTSFSSDGGGASFTMQFNCAAFVMANEYVGEYGAGFSVRCLRGSATVEETSITVPSVTTSEVSDVSDVSAVCGGEVTADGGAEVTERGVCWGTEPNPTVEGSHTSDGTGTGEFVITLTDLVPNTNYYVRAYATNSVGTVYGEVMSFTTAEEQQQDTCTIVSLPYSEDFESYTTSTTAATGVEPACWELVQEDVEMTDANRPQLYYNSNFAHSGSYSLKLYNRGIYAMPALSEDVELNNVQLDMYLRQANARYQLQVGIWEEDGTFVPVATFNNSTTEVEHVSCDFSSYMGSGRRVAFRNTLGSGGNLNYSTNYLDDIVLSVVNGGAVVDEKSCHGTPTVTDVDGNTYSTVQIGDQCWMRENLRTTHYADGTAIPAGGDNWSETDPYYYVNPDVVASVYGYYYNWPAAMHGASSSSANPSGVQGVCPAGWHLPSDAEWTQLTDYVGSQSEYTCGGSGSNIAKALASTEGWYECGSDDWCDDCAIGVNSSTNNASGYSVVPAGFWNWDSGFGGAGYDAYFWSSTEGEDGSSDAYYPYNRDLGYLDPYVHWNGYNEYHGFSVRCLRDETGGGSTSQTLPAVTTGNVSDVTFNSAVCGGEVTADGGAEVTERGVCWSTETNPTVDGSHTSDGTGTGSFTSNITGLTAGTTYYVRAYATNSVGTAYGEEVSFTTAEEQQQDTCAIITLPYSEDFESYTTSTTAATGVEPACWELVQEDVAMTDANRPQLYYNSNFAHSGSYSLKLSNRGIYAMPALPEDVELNNVKLEMYLRQANARYQLQVGIWEADGTFVPVATFNNSTTEVEHVTCDFSSYMGSGRRIAFRNTLGSGSNLNYSTNYLDDIVLSANGGAVGDAQPCPGAETVTDYDGNTYSTVQIGEQCWMRENLRTTHYADGTVIPARGDNWSETDPYYYVNPDVDTSVYGYYYNWPAAMHGASSSSANPSGVQGVCPAGWHLPSDAEWTQLTDYVSGQSKYTCGGNASYIAKALASTEGWYECDSDEGCDDCAIGVNSSTNNASGFSVVPAGGWDPGFGNAGYGAHFWSSTEDGTNDAWGRYLYYNDADVGRNGYSLALGFSVRCLRDETGGGSTSQTLPAVTTGNVSDVTLNSAVCGGEVTADGGAEVTERGVCWSTEPNPTVEGSHTSDGTGTGEFVITLTDLVPNTNYYIRAYATNSVGTVYGEEVSFTTMVSQQDTCTIVSLPYSEDFESYTTSTTTATGVEPACWELVQEDVAMTDANRPQLYYNSNFAHSGNYSLKLSNRGIYAMPALSEDVELNNVQLDMYLRQANARYQLQVGIWEEDGTFVPVATFNNSTTEVEHVTCDFSSYIGSGRRVAFRNTLGSGGNLNYSTNYLDDIVLSANGGAVGDAQPCPGAETVTDYDGNVYNTVKIGEQCWMRENLRTMHYEDGTAIPAGGDNLSETDPYYYVNSDVDASVYGYYYNWPAAMHGASSSSANPSGVQGICPTGWHLPSDAEWTQLTDYVGGQSEYTCGGSSSNIAKALASETGWNSHSGTCAVGNDQTSNNASGFGAVPAGFYWLDGFDGAGYAADFWSSTEGEDGSSDAYYRDLGYLDPHVLWNGNNEYYGFSVRCLRDETGGGSTSQTLPAVTTGNVSDVTLNSAVCGGEVTADGGAEVTERGVCWSTETNPTVDGSHTSDGAGTGAFSSSITGLTANTTYYVRAYATNSVGTAYGEEVSFTTMVSQQDTCTIVSLPYSEDFESYTTSTTAATGVEPACWELVQEDAAMTEANRPQLYYNSNFAHSGSYSLKLYNRGIYAMPALSEDVELNNVKLEMYLRQANARYQLQVGIWEEDGTFVPVATFNNSTTEVEHVTCDFSSYIGSGRRVAFRNTLGSGGNLNYSTNYLDDIVLNANGGAVGDAQPCPGAETVTDYDGNVYNTVKIGDQCWMRENLRTTHYADGTAIPAGGDNTSETPYYYVKPDVDASVYDYYYNWPAAMMACPTGWHLPSDAEWSQLTDYVGSQSEYTCGGDNSYIAKALASTEGWYECDSDEGCDDCAIGVNSSTNNASGFGAVPAGDPGDDGFSRAGYGAYFWSSTESEGTSYYAYSRNLDYYSPNVGRYSDYKDIGLSVRCLRDETGGGSTSQTLPAVTTGNVSDVTLNSAVCGGEVTADGGAEVTERGVCWSTEPNPTIDGSHTSDGAGTGAFSSSITGLTADTTYYVRAYATNSVGTAYGEEVSFTTTLTIPEGDAQPCPGAETVTDYDGNVYNTVKIGEQCWMRENLRTTHYADGGELIDEWGGDYYYIVNGSNVATYGYLYFWPAVMHGALSSFSNPSHVQGICPTGWHVPSSAEWTQLFDYIGSVPAYRCGGNSSNIAKALASTEGWMNDDNDCTVGNNQGANNASGFSAVPAGHDYDGGTGSVAGFWSTSKGHYCIDVPILTYNNFEVYRECNFECYQAPAIRSSVRCLRDEGYPFSAVTTAPVSNVTLTSADCGGEITTDNGAEVTERGVCWSTEPSPTVGDSHTSAGNGMGTFNIQLADLIPNTTYYVRAYAINSMGTSYGEEVIFMTLSQSIPAGDAQPCPGAATVTDYDGNVYNTVKIGEQCWMKENLKTTHFSDGEVVSGISAPLADDNNVATYGYIYMWYDVMHNATSSDANPSGVQGVCPNGWHVPSDAEYTQLVTYVGSVPAYVCGGNSNYIAKALASQNGWLTTSSISYAIGNNLMANNASGFGAVPAGYEDEAAVYELGFSVGFWTSSIGEGDRGAYYYGLSVEGTDVNRSVSDLSDTYRSVRCLRDETGGGSTSQTLPAVTTGNVSDVTLNSAVCGGEVTADGGAEVTERGVCWSTETNPTVDGSHTSDGAGTGAFSSSITGLTAGTTYYVRAYATNSVGTAYGEEVSFTTMDSQQDTCAIVSLPYSEDFESYTTSTTAATGVEPTCWELVHEDVAMTEANRPQLYYNSNFAHSGNYSLKLSNRGIYAMPALSEDVELNNVQLDMYLRQANARYQLQVGIWEEDGTFVPVATFNNSTTDVEHVTCDFSSYMGSGRRIAFRNVLGGGVNYNYSYNYLDDITLSTTFVVDEKSCPGSEIVTDIDGNVYSTVQIGQQCWMRENLRTTKEANGTPIPAGGDATSYDVPYYYYDYNSTTDNSSSGIPLEERGYLYNWPAAMVACPAGWHLPSDAEWNTMEATVSGSDWQTSYETTIGWRGNHAGKLAGGDNWTSSSMSGAPGNYGNADRNASGFGGVPAGGCGGSSFYGAFGNATFWSATQDSSNGAYYRSLYYKYAGVDRNGNVKDEGLSVRCLRD